MRALKHEDSEKKEARQGRKMLYCRRGCQNLKFSIS
jgi:hypothetical protein